jgi:site-specific DNA-methyltransferase (adenine-specific)
MMEDIEVNKIYCENNLQTMARMPDGFCDMVLTSPPYAQARKSTYGGINADEYVTWFIPIAREIYRILSPKGSFILNIGDNTINGETHIYTFEIPIVLKRELNFKFIDPLIWHKKNAPPGAFVNRFKDSWEFCYHFSKTLDITFNPQAVARPSKQVSIERALRHKETHEMKSLSGSGFTNPSATISRRIRQNGSGVGTDDSRLAEAITALPCNVLYLSPETTNTGHSAAFPSTLPSFFIQAFSNENDLIYDPFMGSGTTAIAAHQLNRRWIGSEISQEYVTLAEKRLEPYLMQADLF